VARPRGSANLRLGAAAHANEFDAFQRNVMTSATQDIMRDATRDRAGLFIEWEAGGTRGLRGYYGVRTDYVRSDTDDILNSFPPAAADLAAFNARDHDKDAWHLDATTQWRYAAAGSSLEYHAGLARKTRSPSLLERYLWTPLSASAGQADGRTYLGNLALRPEVSHQASVGVAFRRPGVSLRPSLFYNRVTDYIQGTPIARVDGNGNPVLQYQNVDAELYGIDGDWRWQAATLVALGGTLSYVRGENRDTNDNLYRLAPLNGLVYADFHSGRWNHRAEVKAAARQDRVANYNDEQESDAWAILTLRTEWISAQWRLRAGVENLLNENYHDHLSGFNRVNDGDVAVGDPIPGAGRFAYVNATLYW
jgi:iron complex outermembrane receptor protein